MRWRPTWCDFSRPKQGFLLESHSESPAGAGISGSSAMMICTSAALARFVGRDIDIEQIRVIAQNVEAQLIRVPTGCQDYYPAMYGGVNAIHLDPDGIHCEPIAIAAEEVNKRFVLFYTGAPRQSGINNWEVFKQHINGDKHVIRNFAEISRIAQEMHRAVKRAQWDDVERLLHEEWTLRRTNAPGITTPLIDKLIAAARKQGARAAKVCGAGGGGCVIAFVEEGSRERVHEAIRNNGGQPLDFQVARAGLRFQPVPGPAEISMFTDTTGRLQPIWAFVFSALLSVAAFLLAGYSAAAVAGDHVLRFEAVFRPVAGGVAAGNLQLDVELWESR